jgi:hypothetical protein
VAWALTHERIAKLEVQRDEMGANSRRSSSRTTNRCDSPSSTRHLDELTREQDERDEANTLLRQQVAKKNGAAKMKPAYDDDDLDDLDELSDDFECKHKPATKSAAKSAAPVVKKPLATTAAKPAATATKQTTLSFGAAKPTTLAAEKPKPALTFRRHNGAFEFGENDVLSFVGQRRQAKGVVDQAAHRREAEAGHQAARVARCRSRTIFPRRASR